MHQQVLWRQYLDKIQKLDLGETLSMQFVCGHLHLEAESLLAKEKLLQNIWQGEYSWTPLLD